MDLAEVRAMMPINRHRLDDHLEQNASMMERIGRQVAVTARALADAKRRLDSLEARLVADLQADDPKMTNPKAEKEVKRDATWRDAWDQVQEAAQEHAEWEAAQTAWKQRSFDLRTLGDLYGAEYFTITSISKPWDPSGQDLVDNLRAGLARLRDQGDSPQPARRVRVDA